MQRAPIEEGIKLDLLQTIGRADAFLVARGGVTRRRLAFAAGYGAFDGDNFSGHGLEGA